ncbi:hypothetical protein L6R50_01625 [Myxococcota bacterium]|nr:hypothetical protein [Myxococcota bacterium]
MSRPARAVAALLLAAGCSPTEDPGEAAPAFLFRLDVTVPTDQDPLSVVETLRLRVQYADGSEASFESEVAGAEEIPLSDVPPGDVRALVLEGLVGGLVAYSGRTSGAVDLAEGGQAALWFAREGTVGRMPTELSSPRAWGSAWLLPDGRVAVVGGSTWDSDAGEEALSATIEVIDPGRPADERAEVVGQGFQRMGGGFARLDGSRPDDVGDVVYLGGGSALFDPGTVGIEEADASAGMFWLDAEALGTGAADLGSLPEPRCQGVAVTLPEGRIGLTGGYKPEGNAREFSNIVYVVDAATGVVESSASLRRERVHHAVAPLPGGDFLIAGGAGIQGSSLAAVPEVETWHGEGTSSTGPDLGEARAWLTATPLPDGTVLLAGGGSVNGNGDLVQPAAVAEVYDPLADEVRPTAEQPNRPRADHAATPLPNGDVLLCGGWSDRAEPEAHCEVYRFATDSFDGVPDDEGDSGELGSGGRAGVAAVALPDGDVLLLGGWSGRPKEDVFRYHPTSAEATPFAARPAPPAPRPAPGGTVTGRVVLHLR